MGKYATVIISTIQLDYPISSLMECHEFVRQVK